MDPPPQFFDHLAMRPRSAHKLMARKCRRWSWTINNPAVEVQAALETLTTREATVSYVCYGIELAPTTATVHLQGYIEIKHPVSMARVKSLLSCDDVHLEQSKGTPSQNREYCSKEGVFQEFGTISLGRQGQRSDLDNIQSRIRDGASDLEIANEFFGSWLRYRKGISAYRALINRDTVQPNFTIDTFPLSWQLLQTFAFTSSLIIWGDSGIGKTEFAKTILPNSLFVTHMDVLADYDPSIHSGIIFDDMDFLHLPRTAQIHLVDVDNDRHIHIRYDTAFIPKNTKKIFITNNDNGRCLLTEDAAIKRRVSIHHLIKL